jgi:hypothetical protein
MIALTLDQNLQDRSAPMAEQACYDTIMSLDACPVSSSAQDEDPRLAVREAERWWVTGPRPVMTRTRHGQSWTMMTPDRRSTNLSDPLLTLDRNLQDRSAPMAEHACYLTITSPDACPVSSSAQAEDPRLAVREAEKPWVTGPSSVMTRVRRGQSWTMMTPEWRSTNLSDPPAPPGDPPVLPNPDSPVPVEEPPRPIPVPPAAPPEPLRA